MARASPERADPRRAADAQRGCAARRLGFGLLTKRPIPEEITWGWIEPSLADRDVRRDVIGLLRRVDSRDTLAAAKKLRDFDRPTLIAWAREDIVFRPRYAERLARDIPNSRVEWIEDSRSFVSEDQPERLAELIGAFVRQVLDAHRRGEPLGGQHAGFDLTDHRREPPSSAWAAGRFSIEGRMSPMLSSSLIVLPICRSAAFGCSPPTTPSSIQGVHPAPAGSSSAAMSAFAVASRGLVFECHQFRSWSGIAGRLQRVWHATRRRPHSSPLPAACAGMPRR